MKEGWEKIQQGLRDKTNGPNNLNLAQNEKKEKQKREKLEQAFENEFFGQEDD